MALPTLGLLALLLPQAPPLDDPDGAPVLHTELVDPASLAPLLDPEASPEGDAPWLAAALGGQCSGIAQAVTLNGDGVEGDGPTEVRFLPNGQRYLISHLDSRNLVEFDVATNDFLREIALPGSPLHFTVSPDSATVYASLVFEDTVIAVDLATEAELFATGGIGLPGPIEVSADGTLVAVADLETQEVVVLDAATGAELRRIGGLGFTSSLSFSPENGAVSLSTGQLGLFGDGKALHPDFFNDQIEVLDLVAGTSTVLPSATRPRGFAITPDGTTAVVTHTTFDGTDQVISVLDLTVPTIVKTIPIGQNVSAPVAIDPTGTQAVVAVQNAAVVVDLVNDTVGPNLNTASNNALLTTADGQYVLSVGFRGSLISFATGSVVTELNNQVSTAFGAVSPTVPRAVMVATTFGENRVVVTTNGSQGGLEVVAGTGEPLEADSTRRVAVSADGTRAVTTNILSDTATVWDATTGEVLGVVTVGDRPSDVEITPDGTRAVVANLDSNFASVIDLDTLTRTNVLISTRGSEVEISPDGQFAYVAVVSSGDGVWRIDLNTLTTSGGKLLTGNMGSVGYLYSQTSGMELSPDGATLAVCGSFTDDVTFIDTASWSVEATVTTGDFPTRVVFTPNGNRAYVSCRNADTLVPIRRTGTGWSALGPVAVGDQPGDAVVSLDGSTLYLLEYGDDAVAIVDVAGNSVLGRVPFGDDPAAGLVLSPDGSTVYVAVGGSTTTFGGGQFTVSTSGRIVAIDTAAQTVVADVENAWAPADLAAGAGGGSLLVAAIKPDGLGLVQLDQTLVGNIDALSLAEGGTQEFCLDFGSDRAGELYLLLGSLSGTTPGTPLNFALLPLNVDAYTNLALVGANQPPFIGFFGTLDGLGEATAALALPAGLNVPNLTLFHAAISIVPATAEVTEASNPVTLELVD